MDYFLSLMPAANNYDTQGDGLNTAGGRWTRGTRGADNMYGIGEDPQRKQINLKIDHVFSARHRVNGSWSFEKTWADNNFKVWPNGWGGRTERQPQVVTINFTSTLSPTLLNEARFGVMRTGNNGYFPMESPETGLELQKHLPQINGLPVVVSPGTGGALFSVASSNFYGGRGGLLGWTNHDLSPRWTYGDTLNWAKGKHSFKSGGELRLNRTKSSVYGTNWGMNVNPYALGGDAQGLAVQGINSTNMPGLAGSATAGNQLLMQNLLTLLSGSLGSVSELYFINSPNATSWNDPTTEKEKIRDIHQSEFDVFFKDDWKVHENLTRNIRSNLTVDVRYVGTLTRKNINAFNINTPNFLTNGLLEAFNAARYGDDTNPATQLLDQIFAPVRGTKSGASYLRTSTRGAPQVRSMLANANYQGLATAISNWSNPNAPAGTTDNGWLLRTAGFAENFIVTNPQFSAVNLYTNWGYANYHSMQAQVTMRPTHGVSFQVSYTWSKNLGNPGGSYTDPRNRAGDYTVLSSDRPHVVTSYGTFELPIGPNRLLFGSSSGTLARFLENWQASWIVNMSSGIPLNVTAQTVLYGTGVPDQVGNFPYDKIGVSWKSGAYQGNYFADYFQYVNDPQKTNVTTKDSLSTYCTLTAVADANGNIILQNPLPGHRGNFGQNRFYGPGTWNADMALSKSVKIGESKSVQLRVDATNIFNHPQPAGSVVAASTRIYYGTPPLLSILSANNTNNPFGYLGTKVGQRAFQARIRFSF